MDTTLDERLEWVLPMDKFSVYERRYLNSIYLDKVF